MRADVGGDQAGAALRGEPGQQPGLAAGARAQVQPEAVLAVGAGGAAPRRGQAHAGEGERGELAGFVLDGGVAAGDERGRVAAGQPQAVGRPAGRVASGAAGSA